MMKLLSKTKYTNVLVIASIILILFCIHGHSLISHYNKNISGKYFNDDIVQQIIPFLKYEDPHLFQNDYAAEYFMACMPIGFKGIYILAGKFNSVLALSRTLPYILLLIVLISISIALRKYGGNLAVFFASCFILASNIYFSNMTGGLARSFGYPIIALGILALMRGKAGALACLVVLGASFYPSAAFPLGMSLFVILFMFPAKWRGSASLWSFKKRLGILLFAGIFSAALILPNVISLKKYGSPIRPSDVKEFPEAGEGGRYRAQERAPFSTFFQSLNGVLPKLYSTGGDKFMPKVQKWLQKDIKDKKLSRGRIILWIYLGVVLAGIVPLIWFHNGFKRLLALFAVLGVSYYIACKFAPYFYLPERYIIYPFPLILTVLFTLGSYGLQHYIPFIKDRHKTGVLLMLLVCGSFILFFSGKMSKESGLAINANDFEESKEIFSYVGKLPEDVIVAAWPSGIANFIPYLSQRKTFLSFEVHMAFHKEFTLEMRRRMETLIKAYYTTEKNVLVDLRDSYKVDYLIINKKFYKEIPRYFKPFDKKIKTAFENYKINKSYILENLETLSIYQSGRYYVVDLSKV